MMKYILRLQLPLFSLLILLYSCKKEFSYENPNNNDPTTLLTAGVQGIITDDNGAPLQGVAVRAGNRTVFTDVNGSFSVASVSFAGPEAFVIASKTGFFTGSRTFIPGNGRNEFIRIRLLPKNTAGTFPAASGGTVTVGPASIVFMSNSLATANGLPYSGQVVVKGYYLDPADPELNDRMPGDLRGIRTSGEMRGLRSLGMMAVELEDAAGNPLQIRAGMTATLDLPVPASLNTVAPSSVPLWYFDNASGLWKEESSVNKIGNRYRGSVSHFTFWNVDVPYELVYITMRIVTPTGTPIPGMEVKLTSLSDSTQSYDYSDADGYVNGFVPKNTALRREVLDECSGIVNSATIGPYAANANTGNVIIAAMPGRQTISGSVTDCGNLPLVSGHVIITMPGRILYGNVVNGVYSVTFSNCSGATSVNIVAVNDATQQQSAPMTVNLLTHLEHRTV